MKNRKIIKALGSTVLTASLFITGCSVAAKEDTSKETEKETTKETTEEEDPCDECDPCGCVLDDDDEIYYSCVLQSTNGELEDQMEYMVPYPSDADWDSMPDEWLIDDMSVIEDEDIRALAQSYYDDGYSVNDPETEVEFGCTLGDGEYIFSNGFSAYRDNGRIYSYVSAYKMNETLFNYYFVEWNGFDESTLSDDGTVIRYGEDDYYVEFNRDTGIGVYFGSFDSSQGVG